MRLFALMCLALPGFAQSPKVVASVDEFARDWTFSKAFTLAVAEKMPAEKYGFKATDAEMNFGTLMFHIAASNVFRFAQISGIKPPARFAQRPSEKLSKEDILAIVADSFDYVIAVLPQLTAEQLAKPYTIDDWQGRKDVTARDIMMNMFVHTAHHRAQAEVYLRLNGIVPPAYQF